MRLTFTQVDVFSSVAMAGNPVAVVHNADELQPEQMRRFARWTNLSETTFLLNPDSADADFALRIFTPTGELPFAGHPTLGSCHAWLSSRDIPRQGSYVQECPLGLIEVRRDGDRLAFAAPPLQRTGEVDDADLAEIVAGLGLQPSDVVAAQHIDNGPPWVGLLLKDAAQTLALTPRMDQLRHWVGVIAPHPAGAETDYEVRAFAPSAGMPEDPVTGSLNAGLAQWLIAADLAPTSYTVAQGTVLQRAGRVFIDQRDDTVWVGGHTTTRISGTVRFDPPAERDVTDAR